jgi:hypothetical protein
MKQPSDDFAAVNVRVALPFEVAASSQWNSQTILNFMCRSSGTNLSTARSELIVWLIMIDHALRIKRLGYWPADKVSEFPLIISSSLLREAWRIHVPVFQLIFEEPELVNDAASLAGSYGTSVEAIDTVLTVWDHKRHHTTAIRLLRDLLDDSCA